jgi:hypothetical protein
VIPRVRIPVMVIPFRSGRQLFAHSVARAPGGHLRLPTRVPCYVPFGMRCAASLRGYSAANRSK